jgi:hypothetical protein
MASALPVYQRLPSRCWAGTVVMYWPRTLESRQVVEMCRSRECDLYWVSTQMRCRPALTRFDSTKSIRR